MRVLVISDPTTEISSAAMDVAVGSLSDPPDYNGLAHFCEHMLFYASTKYPEEGAYSDFLTRHGGYDNAYTSMENTNYFFRVNSDYLHDALDRFAQFFISPIFSQDAVSREVNAVNSEHTKNLQNDDWRLWELLKEVSNPSHPFHQFNTGDLETLDKPGVLNALKTFYNSHYSANQVSQ
jgi:insulysin